jgi:hypothetical protein
LLEKRPAERRRILLLISETRDEGSESKLRDAVAEAEVNNILIYSLNIARSPKEIFPGGLTLDPGALIKEIYSGLKSLVIENPLSVLTRYTGGRQYSFVKQTAFEDAVTKIGEEIHGQYLLNSRSGRRAEYRRLAALDSGARRLRGHARAQHRRSQARGRARRPVAARRPASRTAAASTSCANCASASSWRPPS